MEEPRVRKRPASNIIANRCPCFTGLCAKGASNGTFDGSLQNKKLRLEPVCAGPNVHARTRYESSPWRSASSASETAAPKGQQRGACIGVYTRHGSAHIWQIHPLRAWRSEVNLFEEDS